MSINNSKVTFFLVLTLCMCLNSYGQNKLDVFYSLIQQDDTSAVEKHLENWASENPEDAELYVAYFNFYFFTSRTVEMQVVDNPEDYASTQIINADSITKEEDAIHAIPKVNYNRDILNKGFSYIDKGILKNPNRLDMRFGKVFVLNQIEDYESSKTEIINLINHSVTIDNNWLWTYNKEVDDSKESMLKTIHSYIIELTQSSDSNYHDKIEQICKTILKHYPNHTITLTNLSNVYAYKKDYDKSLEMLMRAYDLSPKDLVVIANIAGTYEDKNDTPNALKFYKLMNEIGTKDAKSFAKRKIKELTKK